MKENIDAAVKKVCIQSFKPSTTFDTTLVVIHVVLIFAQFSGNFSIALFHYDGKTSEWDQFEWSKRAIHVSVPKQTKWLVLSTLLVFGKVVRIIHRINPVFTD